MSGGRIRVRQEHNCPFYSGAAQPGRPGDKRRRAYQGRDLLKLQDKQLDAICGREIAMIFQDIMYSLNPVFTIGNQMTEIIRRHLHYKKKDAEALSVELLQKTGITQPETVMHKFPHQLSGACASV